MAKIKDNSKAVIKAIDQQIQNKLVRAATTVERLAKQKCPRRTGRLVRSITRRIDKRKVTIGSNVSYAPIVELGSRPHIIKPKTAAALWWKGLPHPVKMVHHPGTRPKPYLRPALMESKKEIERIFKER